MRLHEELYIDITIEGEKQHVEKFIAYIKSGELDEFFEIDDDFFDYCDHYDDLRDFDQVKASFSNENYGIEIDSFDPEEFLDVFCAGGGKVLIHGNLYDIEDEEYRFISNIGDTFFTNAKSIVFRDELDIEASREESEAKDDGE
jgi:hypothetical protein